MPLRYFFLVPMQKPNDGLWGRVTSHDSTLNTLSCNVLHSMWFKRFAHGSTSPPNRFASTATKEKSKGTRLQVPAIKTNASARIECYFLSTSIFLRRFLEWRERKSCESFECRSIGREIQQFNGYCGFRDRQVQHEYFTLWVDASARTHYTAVEKQHGYWYLHDFSQCVNCKCARTTVRAVYANRMYSIWE